VDVPIAPAHEREVVLKVARKDQGDAQAMGQPAG
jgi:hypothetical protein